MLDYPYKFQDDERNSTTNTNMMNRTPVAGHISSLRAAKNEEQVITTTIKDASKKHRDPRTGLVQEGPSVQGPITVQKNDDQYYSVENGHNNGFDADDEANAVSGKLDINIKDDKKSQDASQLKDNLEQKSSTPPPKSDTKSSKPKKASGIRRVFSLGKNSNSNSESNEKSVNDGITPSLNSTAPKSNIEQPITQENGTHDPSQPEELLPAPTSHYLVEDSAYGSMDVIKKW